MIGPDLYRSDFVEKHLFIDGKWVTTEQYTTLTAPYNGSLIAELPSASPADVNDAIESAAQATSVMASMPAHQRAKILENLVTLMEDRRDEAAKILAAEAAKPITTAYTEVDRTIQTYKFAAEEAKRIHGETLPLDAAPGGEGRVAYTVREPLGVIGAITPFNFR
ncbi:hypothetical protein GCM10025857_20670 [Alicyclobacillus contaminans]|nr:hypothetical protein GCM10025857_20670 [Alicyclobacillus contaminans]